MYSILDSSTPAENKVVITFAFSIITRSLLFQK